MWITSGRATLYRDADGDMVVMPIKFIGLGEQPDDLQPFDAKQFSQALFEE